MTFNIGTFVELKREPVISDPADVFDSWSYCKPAFEAGALYTVTGRDIADPHSTSIERARLKYCDFESATSQDSRAMPFYAPVCLLAEVTVDELKSRQEEKERQEARDSREKACDKETYPTRQEPIARHAQDRYYGLVYGHFLYGHGGDHNKNTGFRGRNSYYKCDQGSRDNIVA